MLFCYDITSLQSFRALGGWFQEVKKYTDPQLVAIVATKLDLEEERFVLIYYSNISYFQGSGCMGDSLSFVY